MRRLELKISFEIKFYLKDVLLEFSMSVLYGLVFKQVYKRKEITSQLLNNEIRKYRIVSHKVNLLKMISMIRKF